MPSKYIFEVCEILIKFPSGGSNFIKNIALGDRWLPWFGACLDVVVGPVVMDAIKHHIHVTYN